VFTSLALVLAAACVEEEAASTVQGQPTGDSSTTVLCGDSPKGRAYFDANVRALLDSACGPCHSTKHDTPYSTYAFLDGPSGDYYDALVADVRMVNASSDNSLLLLKGPHTGPGLTAAQEAAVRSWLDIEKARFGGSCGTAVEDPGITCAEAEDQFSSCMKLEDWLGMGVPDVALQQSFKEGDSQGSCFKCHASGVGGNFMANPMDPLQVEELFELMKKRPFIEKLVACQVDPTTGYFQDLIPSNRWKDKGLEVEIHPKYTLSPEYTEALDAWFELVYQQWKNSNGYCK
jgi:hypothetical protein